MKNAIKQVLKVLAIGIVAAILGHILSGCDSGGDGFAPPDALPSANPDALPSVTNPCAEPSVVIAQVSVADANKGITDVGALAMKLCVGSSVVSLYKGDVSACVSAYSTAIAGSPEFKPLTVAQAQAECTTSMTEAQCKDGIHRFVDAAGVQHVFSVDQYKQLNGFGVWNGCTAGFYEPIICTPGGMVLSTGCP